MEEDSRYDPDFEDDDYYRDTRVTNVGLPASQLALIIGVNAVISLVISIGVVLIAGRQTLLGDVVSIEVSGEAPAAATGTVLAVGTGTDVPPETTPISSVFYTVQQGDTLGLIAQRFNVPLYDLMIANGLSNQDFIQVGQQLIIPLGGLPTATPTFTAVPFPTDTPLPFEPPTPLPTGVAIPPEPAVTVGPSPTPVPVTPTPIPTFTPPPLDMIRVVVTEVNGAGDLFQETVMILNQGAGTTLKDWKLEGSPLGIFIFPDIFLFSGGSIRIHTAAGENTPSDLYLNQGEPAWPPGTTILLKNANNVQISKFSLPVSPANTTATLVP